MSYYYNYYIGYKTKENKIYPLGPYDAFGKMHSVFYRSRSFASDLHEDFRRVQDEQITEELAKEFAYEDWNGEKKVQQLKYLPSSELPSGNFIKRGYLLSDDINEYEKTGDSWDLFYDFMTPAVYLMRLQNELVFGSPVKKEKKDDEDWEDAGDEKRPCSDYSYFAYVDLGSKEYEVHMLQLALQAYEFAKIPEGAEMVILEDEG